MSMMCGSGMGWPEALVMIVWICAGAIVAVALIRELFGW